MAFTPYQVTAEQTPMYPESVPVDPVQLEHMPKDYVSGPVVYQVPPETEPERPKYYAKGGPVGALTRARRR